MTSFVFRNEKKTRIAFLFKNKLLSFVTSCAHLPYIRICRRSPVGKLHHDPVESGRWPCIVPCPFQSLGTPENKTKI